MTTYAQMNENMSHNEDESIYAFYAVMEEVKVIMNEEKRKVISCEKQRRHDQKMKRKHHSEITNSSLIQTWLFNFLFPSKYYITVGIDWGIDTLDCAN
jgi:hypothetical protein